MSYPQKVKSYSLLPFIIFYNYDILQMSYFAKMTFSECQNLRMILKWFSKFPRER